MATKSKLIAINAKTTLAVSSEKEEGQDILAVFPVEFMDAVQLKSIYWEKKQSIDLREGGERRIVIEYIYRGVIRRDINIGRAVLEVVMGIILKEDEETHHRMGQPFILPQHLKVVKKTEHTKGKEYDGDVMSGLSALLGFNAAQVERIVNNLNFLLERFPEARKIKPVDGISLAEVDLSIRADWRKLIIV